MQRVTKPLQLLTELSKAGRVFAAQSKFDERSFWEQNIVWGDLDSFQHVNNVKYLRFLESSKGRMRWLQELATAAGGEQAAQDLFKARGIGLILKNIDVDFKRPVNFPDTLLVAHKFLPKPADPAHLIMHAIIWSNAQQRVVTESNAVCVWYDYEKLRKATQGPPPSFASVIDESIAGIIEGKPTQ